MDELTINVPAVYMARDVKILMGTNPFRGLNDDFDVFEAFLIHRNRPLLLSREMLYGTAYPSEYLMYNRGPGSLAVICVGSFPLPSPSLVSKLSLFLSLPVCRLSSLLTEERGGDRSQIIR
jgi:hypothetical protein